MKEYLEFHSEKSHKYWEIEVNGKNITVHYGRVNTVGQKKTKSLRTEQEAKQKAESLIKSKLKKGYKQVKKREIIENKVIDEYLEYYDKYFDITVIDKTETIYSGRKGGTSPPRVTIYTNCNEAIKEAEKKINSHLKMGYTRKSRFKKNTDAGEKKIEKKQEEVQTISFKVKKIDFSKDENIERPLESVKIGLEYLEKNEKNILDIPNKINVQFTESGKLNGTCIFCKSNNNILKSQWKDGLLHGKLIYENQKNILIEQNYKDGISQGEFLYYSKEGTMLYKKIFENGKLLKSFHYNRDKLYKTCTWRNGALEKIDIYPGFTFQKKIIHKKPHNRTVIKHNKETKSLRIESWPYTDFGLNPGEYKNIESLEIINSRICDISDFLKRLHNLKRLYLAAVTLEYLPENIGDFSELESIRLWKCSLNGFPHSFGNLKKLNSLKIDMCPILVLPENLGQLSSLHTLIINDSLIEEIPESIGHCKNLEKVDFRTKQPGDHNYKEKPIDWGFLRKLPASLSYCEKLSNLFLYNQLLFNLPAELENCNSLTTLSAENCNIVEIPRLRKFNNLNRIFFRNNFITNFPDIKGLKRIGLFLNNNLINSIPGYITDIPSCYLAIGNNPIAHLDDSILNLTKGTLYRDLKKYIKKIKVEQGIKTDVGPEIYTLRCEIKEEINAKLSNDSRAELTLKIAEPLFKLNSNIAGFGSEAGYDFELAFPRESESYDYAKLLIDLEVIKPISKEVLIKEWSGNPEPNESKIVEIQAFLNILEQNSIEINYFIFELFLSDGHPYGNFGITIIKIAENEYLGFVPEVSTCEDKKHLIRLPDVELSEKAENILQTISEYLKSLSPYFMDYIEDYFDANLAYTFAKTETLVLQKLLEKIGFLTVSPPLTFNDAEEFEEISDIILKEGKNHREILCGNVLYIFGIFFENDKDKTIGIITRVEYPPG